ncbi:hypothetical protein DUHN55_43490 [Helicobacter pylori]
MPDEYEGSAGWVMGRTSDGRVVAMQGSACHRRACDAGDMTIADPSIRPATDDDWPQIFPFWARIVAEGRTYAYPEGLTSAQAHGLWMERAPGRTVVAEVGGRVVGSAKMGPNRPGRGAHIATASFMVDAEAGTRGVGRALGEHVVA